MLFYRLTDGTPIHQNSLEEIEKALIPVIHKIRSGGTTTDSLLGKPHLVGIGQSLSVLYIQQARNSRVIGRIGKVSSNDNKKGKKIDVGNTKCRALLYLHLILCVKETSPCSMMAHSRYIDLCELYQLCVNLI